jgi:hypothetical protein
MIRWLLQLPVAPPPQGGGSGILEKLVLLAATAILTGFLAPFVLKQIETRRAREQRQTEAWLARQAKVIEAQAHLLDEVARSLWEWRYLLMAVTYYGSYDAAEDFARAKAEYERTLWPTLSKIRYHTSQSRYLVSEAAYSRLVGFYMEIVELDKELMAAMLLSDPVRRRIVLGDTNHKMFGETTLKLDTLLHDLAKELKLAAPTNLPKPTQAGDLHA